MQTDATRRFMRIIFDPFAQAGKAHGAAFGRLTG